MAQQNINPGRPPIVWSTIDDAFNKINNNFTELYQTVSTVNVDFTNLSSDLLPDQDEQRDLGSSSKRWRDLYLSGSSLYLGNAVITANGLGEVNLPAGTTIAGTTVATTSEGGFGEIAVPDQPLIESNLGDTLNLIGNSGVEITTDNSTNTITIGLSDRLDIKGSVFADDSSILVDAVDGKILGDIETSSLRTSETEIALGYQAGSINQDIGTVAVGDRAGRLNQGQGATAIGSDSGLSDQGIRAVAIGYVAGSQSQGIHAVAIGSDTAGVNQGSRAIAVGLLAGSTNQGVNSIAIGAYAGYNSQSADSIVLNATGSALDGLNSGFYVAPIREIDGPQVLYYNPSTKEVSWGSVPQGGNGGGGSFVNFNIAADDSTQRVINSGETIKFIGMNGITTTSNAEGDITISGTNTLGNLTVTGTGIDSNDSSSISFTPAVVFNSDVTVENDLVVNHKISVKDLEISGTILSQGSGTPEIYSDNDILLSAGTRVLIVSSPLKMASFTTAQRDLLSAQNGDIIYNTTVGKLQNYVAGQWDDVGSGSGSGTLSSRTTAAATTGSLADAATGNITVTGFKGYMLYKIQTSHAAWVRIYTNSAARSSDSSRSEGVDPSPGAGVIAEVITTGSQTVLISPGVVGFNDEISPNTNIELAVTNKSGGTAAITVTLTILKVEE